MTEILNPGQEYENWHPSQDGNSVESSFGDKSKLPEGELHGKIVPGLDGKFYDKFGEPVSIDAAYSERFWLRLQEKGEKFLQALKEQMRGNIASSIREGTLHILVGNEGMTEEAKEKLSAYRELARELGYETGQFRFNSHTGMASAEIKKV